MQQRSIQIIGWYGVIAIVVAYALSTLHILGPDMLLYQLLNLTGAVAIASEAWSKRDRQPFVLNMIWAIVAIIGLLQIFL